jgi:D-lactate dehydrogenase (cytochrome)
MEFHAAQAEALNMSLSAVEALCAQGNALNVRSTTDTAERKRLWHARHHSYEIMVRTHPGQKIYVMDVAVPISAYPALIAYARQTMRQHQVEGYMIGHAGDGNVHVELLYSDAASFGRAMIVNGEIVKHAISLEGTATGEHGVGVGKSPYMRLEHGAGLDVMAAIKQQLDPNGILNPGKIFGA